MKNKLIVLCGPSCSGKTIISKALKNKYPDLLEEVISYTTRSKRDNESNAIDYFFVSKDNFENKIREDYFIEYQEVHSNYYGTPKEDIYRILKEKNAICVLDVNGALNAKKIFGDDCCTIFIKVKMDFIEKKLRERNISENEIELRLKNALTEMSYVDKMDKCFWNKENEFGLTIYFLEVVLLFDGIL